MHKRPIILLCIFLVFGACRSDKTEVIYNDTAYSIDFGYLPNPNLPMDNVLTVEGVQLGKMLFFDPILSKDGTQSCASCHDQQNGFSDTLQFSIGVEKLPGNRQAMAIFNMGYHKNDFFWDGRSMTLREQSLKPIQDPLEMNEDLDNVILKLSAEKSYKDQFKRAFDVDEISTEKIGLALEQFMLSIVSNDSKYDRYKQGIEELTESELRGLQLFEAEYNPFFPESSGADCRHCHGGANFENDGYMNNGLNDDENINDFGRENVTLSEFDRGKFKVPTLRNIAVTPPYMHDGRFRTLEEVIDHYNEGLKDSETIHITLKNTMDTGLLLDEQDKKDLLAFLHTLTDYTFLNNTEYNSPF